MLGIRLRVLVVLLVVGSTMLFASYAGAINPYGGPCDVAEDLNYESANWNTLCNMHIMMWNDCCAAGSCSGSPCG